MISESGELSEDSGTLGSRENIPYSDLLASVQAHRDRAQRYTVRKEVGRGGMGCVFSAEDRELRRRVAMKVLMQGNAPGEPGSTSARRIDRTVRFLGEAQVTAQLDHPGIVPVHELGIDAQGSLFFTMKLVRGNNLARVFESVRTGKGGWTRTRALGVLMKVCDAMAFAHSKGVVHRDLKPANVMVGRFGETYVMDWGIARVLGRDDDHDVRFVDPPASTQGQPQAAPGNDEPSLPEPPLVTRDGRVMGTPAYMAPEQAAGLVDEISPRSDVYSLGAILYHLLAGIAPYMPTEGEATPRTVLSHVLGGPPIPIRDLDRSAPEELVAICGKAMSRNAATRYATALELGQDIQSYLERRPVSAQRLTLVRAIRLWVERNHGIAATSAAALVLMAALAVWFVAGLDQSRRETQRLADVMSARALIEEAEVDLTPLLPESRERTVRWLQRTAALLDQLPVYRAEAAAAGEPSPPLTQRELEAMIAEVERLQDTYSRVQRTLLEGSEVPARAAAAMQISWNEVFADLERRPEFRSLPRREQAGLVPLGKNPAGYWMFWHVASGSQPPIANGLPGPLAADSGIVFVLLPGGTDLEMGSREPDAELNEGPVHVTLAPFLLATHETTQGQWQRVMFANPSRRPAGTQRAGLEYTAVHPVESISWFEARRFAGRLGLRLPAAYELEYAGRADRQDSPRFAGLLPMQMKGLENLRDATVAESMREPGGADWSDGYLEHAPVGTFKANPFGMFDVAGNVSEWCETFYGREPEVVGARDPSELPEAERLRCVRGGSWGSRISTLRTSYSIYNRPGYLAHWLGVRLARDWQ
ncbi:MAG TPA: bifunctional serine/threonine-protein kinase/formylglycine-generating enzyme family protein [Planctomycetota bacterium]